MVVIRGGKPVRVGGGGEPTREREADGRAEPAEEYADLDAAKKLKALRKKLRHLLELKRARQKGLELDAAQQERLRKEPALRAEVERFAALVGSESQQGEGEDEDEGEDDENDEEEEEEEGGGSDEAPDARARASPRGSLAERRAFKKQRQKDRVKARRRAAEEGKVKAKKQRV